MKLWLSALLGLLPLGVLAQGVDADRLRAAFVHRFAQFTQWPAPEAGEPLTLCAVGVGASEAALRALEGRRVGGQALRFQSIELPREAAQRCRILVLGQDDAATLRRWVQGLDGAPVLVVGTSPEALRAGVCIALITEPQGLAFSVNHGEAKKRGLVLSGQMLKLAREVR